MPKAGPFRSLPPLWSYSTCTGHLLTLLTSLDSRYILTSLDPRSFWPDKEGKTLPGSGLSTGMLLSVLMRERMLCRSTSIPVLLINRKYFVTTSSLSVVIGCFYCQYMPVETLTFGAIADHWDWSSKSGVSKCRGFMLGSSDLISPHCTARVWEPNCMSHNCMCHGHGGTSSELKCEQ